MLGKPWLQKTVDGMTSVTCSQVYRWPSRRIDKAPVSPVIHRPLPANGMNRGTAYSTSTQPSHRPSQR